MVSFNFDSRPMDFKHKLREINSGAGIQTQDLLDSKAESLNDSAI